MTGDEQTTERKLGEAAELGTRLGMRLAEPWSYWYSPGWLECQRGIALGYLLISSATAHRPSMHWHPQGRWIRPRS